jgi:hypothetical protein
MRLALQCAAAIAAFALGSPMVLGAAPSESSVTKDGRAEAPAPAPTAAPAAAPAPESTPAPAPEPTPAPATEPAAAPGPVATEAAAPPPAGPGPAPYLILGVGGAALVSGGVLAAVTLAQKSDLYYREASTRLATGLFLGSIGLVAVVAGAAWAIVTKDDGKPGPKASVGVVPIVGGAAVCAAGTF